MWEQPSNGIIVRQKEVGMHITLSWRGGRASLEIRQGTTEGYKPILYIDPVEQEPGYEAVLEGAIKSLQTKYPGINLEKTTTGWFIKVPPSLQEGHESHFARVMEKFLEYVRNGNMPEWEVPNMIVKHYTTTEAMKKAKETTR